MPRISDRSIRRGRWLSAGGRGFRFGVGHRPDRRIGAASGARSAAGQGAGRRRHRWRRWAVAPDATLRSAPSVTPAPNVVPAAPAAPPARCTGRCSLPLRARAGRRSVQGADGRPTAAAETASAIAPLTSATTTRPASGSARSSKRRKIRVRDRLPFSSRARIRAAEAARRGMPWRLLCFDSLNRRLLPQGTFPVGHVPVAN